MLFLWKMKSGSKTGRVFGWCNYWLRGLCNFWAYSLFPSTRQGSSIVRRFRTWRWEDGLLWARMKVFRTSFYAPASVERNTYVRLERDLDATSFLRPRRIRTSWKLSYGPKEGRPLNVRGRLAEWGVSSPKMYSRKNEYMCGEITFERDPLTHRNNVTLCYMCILYF